MHNEKVRDLEIEVKELKRIIKNLERKLEKQDQCLDVIAELIHETDKCVQRQNA